MSSNRLQADQLFMAAAALLSLRGTCARARVGAVVVKDRRIISTGYVGSPPGLPHCIDVGCEIVEGSPGCIRTVHAEANAIAFAAKNGVSLEGSTVYTTLAPCRTCKHLLLSAGVTRVVYATAYRADKEYWPGSISWQVMDEHPHLHPFLGYKDEPCLVCGKSAYQH